MVIKLEQPSELSHVRIVNRTGGGDLQKRAADLTLSLSQNGKDWHKIWRAESAKSVWNVEANGAAQFLKLELPRKGTLHLNQVVVYGIPQ